MVMRYRAHKGRTYASLGWPNARMLIYVAKDLVVNFFDGVANMSRFIVIWISFIAVLSFMTLFYIRKNLLVHLRRESFIRSMYLMTFCFIFPFFIIFFLHFSVYPNTRDHFDKIFIIILGIMIKENVIKNPISTT